VQRQGSRQIRVKSRNRFRPMLILLARERVMKWLMSRPRRIRLIIESIS